MSKIEKAIIETLAFFDLSSRPLKPEELWHFLYKIPASKIQVLIGVKNLLKNKIILQKNHYLYLRKSSTDVLKFLAHDDLIEGRLKKVNRVVYFLKYLPFVKNISVINSLSFRTSNKESDIDILLITAKNRLWTARALVILALELIFQNKNKWVKEAKFCLGFAFDETALNLKKIRFKNDILFTYWLAHLTPICDRRIYYNLIDHNLWLEKELPNWERHSIKPIPVRKSWLENVLSGSFGDKLEKYLAEIQMKRILEDPENMRQGASVIANIKMMKLHAYDNREESSLKWQEKVKQYL